MMKNNFTTLFKKEGGKKLILQWFKNGNLFYALGHSFLFGYSKKGLEILRLSIQFRVLKKMKKKFNYVLKNNELRDYESLEKKKSNKVWVCWFQGMDNAPYLVQQCHKSLIKHLNDKEIIILSRDNISKYAQFPLHIMRKWDDGRISDTHFSDILRVEILISHGGTWIDSTVFCSGSNIPNFIFDSELFLFQNLKPGRDGHSINLSSWFITAYTNNKILINTRELLFEYWKKNDSLIDYFLFHMFLELSFEKYPNERKKMIQFCNSVPHILLLQLFEPFDELKYRMLSEMTPFHKLNYKRTNAEFQKQDTFFDAVINNKFPI